MTDTTERDEITAKYFREGWLAALREVRLRGDRAVGEFLVEQLDRPARSVAYNVTPNVTAERRYGEAAVILRNGDQVLEGTQFVLYPVDEPPVIEVPSLLIRWYRKVWEGRGWAVENPPSAGEGI